jgi:K+-transporting ATPase ATPase C chain
MRSAISSAIAVVVLTAVLGFGYPALMTGFGRVAFPAQANGSLVTAGGRVVGSRLAAQAFTSPRYFHPRPSAAYDAGGTTFANLGPTSTGLARDVAAAAAAVLRRERP